jgi:molybdopterin-guanine dinucleotide biosynthesis protein A
MSINKIPLTTVILAGGKGTRIGGNKGLQILHGRSLISWVAEVVKCESEEVLISANESQDVYAKLGCRVIVDQMPDWPGPLAGLEAALSIAKTQYVLSVPCDTPFLPDDLIPRLLESHLSMAVEASVAVVAGHRQPAIALYNISVLPRLREYLDSGRRKVNDWLDSLQLSEVIFDNEREFNNINTQEDLAQANLVQMKTQANPKEI